MAALNTDQTALIGTLIQMNGVKDKSLIIDLHDHMCTQVEAAMDLGQSYESALTSALSAFGESGLQHVQDETYAMLKSNTLNMKTITFVIGTAAAVMLFFGTTFKIMHWPFANILIVLGAAHMIMFFLPLLLIHNLRSTKTVMEGVFHVAGYLGLAVFGSGVLFKSLHWPFATNLLTIGATVLLLIYVPLYFLRRYRQSTNKSITAASFLVSFSSLLLLTVLLPKLERSDLGVQRLISLDAGLVMAGQKMSDHTPQNPSVEAVVASANNMLEALILSSGGASTDAEWVTTADLELPNSRAGVRFVVFEESSTLLALCKAMNALRTADLEQRSPVLPFEAYLAKDQDEIQMEHLQTYFVEVTLAEAVHFINRIKVDALHHASMLASIQNQNLMPDAAH